MATANSKLFINMRTTYYKLLIQGPQLQLTEKHTLS